MGSKVSRAPGYLRHKSSGQARVRIHGHDYYLGRYNSPESRKRYHHLIAQLSSDLCGIVLGGRMFDASLG